MHCTTGVLLLVTRESKSKMLAGCSGVIGDGVEVADWLRRLIRVFELSNIRLQFQFREVLLY